MNFRAVILCFLVAFSGANADFTDNIKQANSKIQDIKKLLGGEKDLQWNRYVTKNFEILSIDDPQGQYLNNNVENIKTWILWRWGIKDIDLSSKCKLMCVPSQTLYENLFFSKTPQWKADKDGYKVWMITDGQKWNTKLPVFLTEVILTNFEVNNGIKLPVWTHRGMSVLNGRIEDIRSSISLVGDFSSSKLLTMTEESYYKLSESDKVSFDAKAASFCLWAKKEFSSKTFLDFMSGSVVNPEYCLQYFELKTFAECDLKVKSHIQKLSNSPDTYFTW